MLQLATTLVVNNRLAIDAGCLGFAAAETQAAVADVVLTHAHMDHVATLPFYVATRLQTGAGPARIHAPADVLAMVREGLFNDRLWPDLERLSTPEETLIEFHELPIDEAVAIGEIELVAIPVDHVIPTYGYLLSEPGCSVVVATDTRDTELIWERAAQRDDLAGVFVESSFPESLAELADASGHLTPAGLARQLDRINRPVRTIAVHLKPSYRDKLLVEIAALGRDTVEVGLPGTTYTF